MTHSKNAANKTIKYLARTVSNKTPVFQNRIFTRINKEKQKAADSATTEKLSLIEF